MKILNTFLWILSSIWSFILSRLWYSYEGPSIKPPRTFKGRQQWSKKLDFLMACTGYAVGLGNVWRFPYIMLRFGGGAFLIPYFIVTLTSGVPLFFLEIALGQFTGQGCVTCWKLCPAFKGIGYGIVVLCTWLNIYYIVVLAWSLYYFGMSFSSVLPWASCHNEWNTENCITGRIIKNYSCIVRQDISLLFNVSAALQDLNSTLNESCKENGKLVDSAEEFWRGLKPLMCRTNCTFCLMNTCNETLIVYFTALFPYAMLLVLLIRGVTLDGAMQGIEFYLKPNYSKLLESQVWLDAGTQIFFAYAVSTGALISMGSYNKFTNNCYLDSWIICVINSGTSILSGFCIFSVLGYMAVQMGVPVDEVVKDGPGLAFIAYPKALSQMPGYPQIWAILFFSMLVFLGIDSEFVGLEGLFTTLLDIYPEFRLGYRPEITMFVACFLSFVFGLCMCTQGGIYIFQVFDYYSASGFVLLWFCFFECLAIGWIYGARRFYKDLSTMMGFQISPWMLTCWTILAPLTSCAIFVISVVQHTPITLDDYKYPVWGDAVGLFLSISSMICIPLYFVYRFIVSKGNSLYEKSKAMLTPEYSELLPTSRLSLPTTSDRRLSAKEHET